LESIRGQKKKIFRPPELLNKEAFKLYSHAKEGLGVGNFVNYYLPLWVADLFEGQEKRHFRPPKELLNKEAFKLYSHPK
jgi:hypothetical protein